MIQVFISGRNTARWVDRCLASVLEQRTQREFSVLWVDDQSDDDSYPKASSYRGRPAAGNCTGLQLVQNPSRVGQLANITWGVSQCVPEDIVVLLDGDDWFEHADVLDRVMREYDQGAWMTYGQYRIHDPQSPLHGRKGVCKHFVGDVRKEDFAISHLRTFRAALYKRINPADFFDKEGRFYTVTGDMAFMFPMYEMARDRAHFIPDVLYVYNRETPFNDFKQCRDQQLAVEKEIRAKPPYDRLTDLTWPDARNA
jgi:glycosyltransferase involved in cell wall biosynthesis